MERTIPSDQLITQYLLGSLSVEETDRLDELSMSDDEFAQRLQAIENDLVDAYVGGELSGQALQQFNAFYLSSPKRREKVRFAQVFHTVVQDPGALRAQPAVAARPISHRSAPYSRQRLPLPTMSRGSWQWGLAAAASILLAVAGWLVLENWRLRGQMNLALAERAAVELREQELLSQQRASDTAKEAEVARLLESRDRIKQELPDKPSQPLIDVPMIVALALTPQTRGISRIASVTVPADTDFLALELQLESGDYAGYRATLKALSDGRVIWRSGRLKSRSSGSAQVVGISLRPALLRSAGYMAEVVGISAGGSSEAVGSYVFRVIKP